MPVTMNRTPASAMTDAGTSLARPETAGTNIEIPAVTSRTPSPALVEPGGDVYVVRPTTAHVPVSTPMPVAATGSRARNPMIEETSCSGTVAAIAVSAATRPCSGGIHPSWSAANTVVARARARKPNGRGVASGRSTTRVAGSSRGFVTRPAPAGRTP
jgi:hypothetical protein